ncbi:hypothetical protein OK411_13395 [Pseudomonas sp. RG1]|uniref:hypothetical protein n=1 Tax=Pseudomonas sp. RG1 TaxID=2981602 RepID=UPI00221E740E|nr:hypothetical protein [Pseudomonas sp. RG1]MCW0921377.1 hypothetical protein [Pseudomonas sp. RG1]
MAMFEIDESEDVRMLRCKTDSETLVKGKRLHGLEAEDCEVKHNPNPPATRKVFIVAAWVMGIVGAVIAAFFTKLFGLV